MRHLNIKILHFAGTSIFVAHLSVLSAQVANESLIHFTELYHNYTRIIAQWSVQERRQRKKISFFAFHNLIPSVCVSLLQSSIIAYEHQKHSWSTNEIWENKFLFYKQKFFVVVGIVERNVTHELFKMKPTSIQTFSFRLFVCLQGHSSCDDLVMEI